MMENNWIKIFATRNPTQAEILKGMLEANGIAAVVINHQSSSFNLTLGGSIDVMVNEEDETTARSLMESESFE